MENKCSICNKPMLFTLESKCNRKHFINLCMFHSIEVMESGLTFEDICKKYDLRFQE